MANYTIGKGDTLSAIAKANNTTVSALAKANNISDPNKIRAGSSLSIPGASSTNANVSIPGGSATLGSGWTAGGVTDGTTSGATSGQMGFTGYRPRTAIDIHGGVHQGLERGDTAYDTATGYLQHRNGYVGQATMKNGKYYTPYGALIREDSMYTPGSILSPNGMYEDTGSGFFGTNYAGMVGPGGFRMAVPGDMQTMMPNQVFPYSEQLLSGLGSGGGTGGGSGGAGNVADTAPGNNGETGTSTDDILALLRETSRDLRLQEYYEQQMANRGF